jgi:hypothetical protein
VLLEACRAGWRRDSYSAVTAPKIAGTILIIFPLESNTSIGDFYFYVWTLLGSFSKYFKSKNTEIIEYPFQQNY